MHYGFKIIYILIISSVLASCSPHYRFIRLVTKYPYLLDSIQQNKVIVRDSIHQDTQIIWKNKIDTLILNQIKIERRNDTFRIITRERPCTTYIQETTYKPSKIVEKYIQEKQEKGFFGALHKIKESLWLIIIGLLLLLLITRK